MVPNLDKMRQACRRDADHKSTVSGEGARQGNSYKFLETLEGHSYNLMLQEDEEKQH